MLVLVIEGVNGTPALRLGPGRCAAGVQLARIKPVSVRL